MPYFEEMKIGDRRDSGSFVFTADNIKAFAIKFDPQPFHLDEEAGRSSIFGGLAASGWHVAAAWMKMMVASMQREIAELRARGEQVVLSAELILIVFRINEHLGAIRDQGREHGRQF